MAKCLSLTGNDTEAPILDAEMDYWGTANMFIAEYFNRRP
jgi:hypothetical protein